jgi:hypothetical protein
MLLGCLLVCGCSREEPGAIVRGTVTYKGAPLDQGTIMFYPSGSGQGSYGRMQEDGSFQLINPHKTERIQPGTYVAVVLAGNDQIAAAKEDPTFPVHPVVPLKFSSASASPLKYDIGLGENVLDVNLDKF